MRKVLYISMVVPYENVPSGGGKTFYYYIKNLQELSSFHVEMIAKLLDTDEINDETLPNVRKYFVKNQTLSITNPIQSLRDIFSKINPLCRHGNVLRDSVYRKIKKQCKILDFKPDVIVLEFTQMVLMVDEIKRYFPNALIIASEHDVSYLGAKRLYDTEKNILQRLYRYLIYWNIKKRELSALSRCDVVMPHNIKDKNLLVYDGIAEDKIWILTPYFQNKEINRKPDYQTVLFYGAMNRMENEEAAIWFIENVMKVLKNNDLRFVVIGNRPSKKLKSYASKTVEITGFVKDITPYMEKCTCAVVPLIHGAGIKIKTLEFLAMGVPVLSNTIGIEGISALEGKEYIHCEHASDYIEAIKMIFRRDIDIDLISANARQFIKQHFNLSESFEQYKKIILQD